MSKKNVFSNPYRKGDEDHLYFDDPRLLEGFTKSTILLETYFRYEVCGMENIPQKGPAMLVLNHGLMPFDMVLLAGRLYREYSRKARVLIHERSWNLPIFREIALNMGIMNASPENAARLLEKGEIISVFPGGEREGLKPSSQKYQLLWEGRYGFIKTAMKTQSPIIPCMSVGIDDLFHVMDRNLPFLKALPLPLFLGLGVFPLPVKITHYIGKPIYCKYKSGDERDMKKVKAYHKEVLKQSRLLLDYGLKQRQSSSLKLLKNTVVASQLKKKVGDSIEKLFQNKLDDLLFQKISSIKKTIGQSNFKDS